MRKTVGILVLALSLWQCVPDQFALYETRGIFATDLVARGIILKPPYDGVKVSEKQGALTLHDDAWVALRRYGVTQYVANFFLRIPKGEEATIYVQPQLVNKQIIDSGFVLHLSPDGWQVRRGQSTLAAFSTPLELRQWLWIQLYRFGEQFHCIVQCDTARIQTGVPATDWIVFHAPREGQVEIRQYRWHSEEPERLSEE